jgi:hypothetical protein|tara:strand:- start:2807 stop:3079 length:273 start_codon:yes stop_codon:yes gene_type:complete
MMKKYFLRVLVERVDCFEMEVSTDNANEIYDMVDDVDMDSLANHGWVLTRSGVNSKLSVIDHNEGAFERSGDIEIEEIEEVKDTEDNEEL